MSKKALTGADGRQEQRRLFRECRNKFLRHSNTQSSAVKKSAPSQNASPPPVKPPAISSTQTYQHGDWQTEFFENEEVRVISAVTFSRSPQAILRFSVETNCKNINIAVQTPYIPVGISHLRVDTLFMEMERFLLMTRHTLGFRSNFWLKMNIISHFWPKKQPIFGMATKISKKSPIWTAI